MCLCKISNRAVIANISVFEIFQSSPAGTEVDTEVLRYAYSLPEIHVPADSAVAAAVSGLVVQKNRNVEIKITKVNGEA